jgi:RimJ/RimL family protein N-acetyltransferase
MNKLEQFLYGDPIWCCYMIGDLDEPFAADARWIGAATPGGDFTGALLVFSKYSPATLVSYGAAEAAEAMLASEGVPDKAFCHIPLDHRPAFRGRYELRKVETMRRMFLRTGDFAPVRADQPKRLSEADIDAMRELYQHYPGHFFDPFQVQQGIYYGIRENGSMVSVAGTHIYSKRRKFAVLGNIVTHRNYRGKGLATACTSKLLQELFKTVDLVMLSVADGNAPAVRSYEKLGFATHTKYLEAHARRK